MKILQTQKATTPPFCRFVTELALVLTFPERILYAILPDWLGKTLGLFFRRNRYDAVITIGHRVAFAYGMLRRLCGSRSVHIAKEIFLAESTLESSPQRCLYRWALRRCDGFVVNCTAECAAYSRFLGLPTDRFRFVPWPSNLEPEGCLPDGNYVFAAGRSFRDWKTLLDAAREIPARFVVVAERSTVAELACPANVELRCDVSRAEYLQLLRGAAIVVIPLCDTVRSIGQVVLLEAMALGKPVIAARVPGVLDYVRDGETGLLYECGNCAALAAQIQHLLFNPAVARHLREQGRKAVAAEFNRFRYAERMTTVVVEVLGHHKREPRAVVPPIPVSSVRQAC